MKEPEPSKQVPLDTVLDALADAYRRRLLVALLEHDPRGDDGSRLPTDVVIADEDGEQLEIHATHIHLPKLEDAGLIEWNRDANEVRRGPQFEEIRPLLRWTEDRADDLPDDWT